MDKNLPKPPALSAIKTHRAQRRRSKLLILEDQLPGIAKYMTVSHDAYTRKHSHRCKRSP